MARHRARRPARHRQRPLRPRTRPSGPNAALRARAVPEVRERLDDVSLLLAANGPRSGPIAGPGRGSIFGPDTCVFAQVRKTEVVMERSREVEWRGQGGLSGEVKGGWAGRSRAVELRMFLEDGGGWALKELFRITNPPHINGGLWMM